MSKSLLPIVLFKLKDDYKKLQEKDPLMFYVIDDTAEVFKGDVSLSEGVRFVDADPTQPAQGIIYINNTTGIGKVFNGTELKSVFGTIAEITDGSEQTTAPSADAVKTYVTDKIKDKISDLNFDTATNSFKFKANDADSSVSLPAFLTGAAYDTETGNLTFKPALGDDIVINLPKDNFIKSGSYDDTKKAIVLVLQNDSQVEIPAGDLVETFEDSTTTTYVSNAETGNKSFEVKISDKAGNSLEKDADKGLYVAPSQATLTNVTDNELVSANADGTLKGSTVKAGSDIIDSEPSDKVLATEKGVSNALVLDTIDEVVNATATQGDAITVNEASYVQFGLKNGDTDVSVAKSLTSYVKIDGVKQVLVENPNVLLISDATEGNHSVVAKSLDDKLYQGTLTYTKAAPIPVPPAPTVSATSGDGKVDYTITGDASATGYKLMYKTKDGAEAWTTIDVTPDSLTGSVTGLTNGTVYQVKATAVNASGVSPESSVVEVTPAVPAPTVPGVASIAVTPGDGKVDYTITAPESDGGSPITSYNVRYRHTDSDWSTAQTINIADPSNLAGSVTGLTNGTSYTFEAIAVNAVGEGANSDDHSAQATPVAA